MVSLQEGWQGRGSDDDAVGDPGPVDPVDPVDAHMRRVPLPPGEVGFRAVLPCPDLAGQGRFIGAVDDRRHLVQLGAQLVAGAANDIHFADHHRPEVCPAPGVAHAAADTASAAMQVR